MITVDYSIYKEILRQQIRMCESMLATVARIHAGKSHVEEESISMFTLHGSMSAAATEEAGESSEPSLCSLFLL